MSKVKIAKERCKACGYCIRECPRKAISFSEHMNEKGYKYIQEMCIRDRFKTL